MFADIRESLHSSPHVCLLARPERKQKSHTECGKFRGARRQRLLPSAVAFPRPLLVTLTRRGQTTCSGDAHAGQHFLGGGVFPGCKHTIHLKGPAHRHERARRRRGGGRGSVPATACFQNTNYRLGGQVSITWTGSLSPPLFSSSSVPS